MDVRTIRLCGRNTSYNPNEIVARFSGQTPVQRTVQTVARRIDIIRDWGFPRLGALLDENAVGIEFDPQARRGAVLTTQGALLMPFSKLDLEESIAGLADPRLRVCIKRMSIQSPDAIAAGLKKAVQIGRVEAERIIKAQKEAICLFEQLGKDHLALIRLMQESGVEIVYNPIDLTDRGFRESDNLTAHTMDEDGHEGISLIFFSRHLLPSTLWNALYMWRKILNGVFYMRDISPLDDQQIASRIYPVYRQTDDLENPLHYYMHDLLDQIFFIRWAEFFGFSADEITVLHDGFSEVGKRADNLIAKCSKYFIQQDYNLYDAWWTFVREFGLVPLDKPMP